MSEFILRPATKSDVPSLVALWYKCFFDPIPLVQKLFPDTEVVRGWYGKGFEKLISKEGNGVRFVVAVELDEEGVEGKVVGFTKWIVEPAGGIKKWQEAWGNVPVAEGMDEELITERFFGPMEKQHGVVMTGREHLFLEIIATDPAYQKRGLAGKMLIWGKEYADKLGVDCYLDAGRKVSRLYEKFGWKKMEESMDEKASSIPMIRSVGT